MENVQNGNDNFHSISTSRKIEKQRERKERFGTRKERGRVISIRKYAKIRNQLEKYSRTNWNIALIEMFKEQRQKHFSILIVEFTSQYGIQPFAETLFACILHLRASDDPSTNHVGQLQVSEHLGLEDPPKEDCYKKTKTNEKRIHSKRKYM